tara:strand:- start:2584 stop:5109 length:2526 start_codon:yes stop_codon:yes gene_type:complete
MKSPLKKSIGEVVTDYGAKVMKVFKEGLLGRSLFDFYGDVKALTFRTKEVTTVPTTPPDGKGGVIYTKNADGKLYYKSNEISEVELSSQGTNTTYSVSCVDGDNSDEEKIRLTGSDSSTDDVVLEAGTGLSIARDSDKITFTNTVTDTNTQNTTTLSFVDSSNDIILRNTTGGAGSGTDDIKFVAGSNVTLTHTDADNITIASTDTNTQLSTEEVQDIAGALVATGGTKTGITVTYDDANNNMDFVVDDLHNVGVDGSANQLITDDGDGTVTSESNFTYDGTDMAVTGDTFTFTSANANDPYFIIQTTSDDDNAPRLKLYNNRPSDGGDDGSCGTIEFSGKDDGTPTENIYGKIEVTSNTTSAGAEIGAMDFYLSNGSGSYRQVLSMQGDGDLDVSGNLQISGDLKVSGNDIKDNDGTTCITFDSSGNTTVSNDLTVGGVAGDATLIISADTDNSTETDNARLWFKQDGDITEGAIQMSSNVLNIINNISTAGGISFQTGTTNNTGTTDPATGATERLAISSAGVVSASGDLTVGGDLTVSGNIINSGVSAIFKSIDTTQNYVVELKGEGGPKVNWGDTDSSTDAFMTMGAFSNINQIDTAARDFHLYGTNTTTGFYFDESEGKFGIGTDAPSEKLSVNGNMTVSGDLTVSGNDIKDSGGTTAFTFSGSGGVTVPSGNLEVGNHVTIQKTLTVGGSGTTPAVTMGTAKITLSTADCNTLHSTPVQLKSAAGANTVILPTGGVIRIDRAATQTNSAADLNFHYADQEPGAYTDSSLYHIRRFMYNETGDRVYMIAPLTGFQSSQNLTDDVNKALEVSVDSALTTNCFTSVTIFLTYNIIDIS